METWTFAWAFRNLIAEFLMPPGIWLIGILFFLFVFKQRALLQKIAIAFFVVMLWVTSTPAFVRCFTKATDTWMHWPSPLVIESHRQFQVKHQASAVADGPQAVILKQVTFGIAVRMAVMSIVAGN